MDNNIKIHLSACLVIHNEEAVIERCLKSIVPIVDEIIVIHETPCLDKTLDIAAKYNAKIIMVPRLGDPEAVRPLSYEIAQGEWILQIDADEFLSLELQQAIPSLILDKNINAYEFLWPIYDGEQYITKQWPFKRCLFRRSEIAFLGLPNYVVEVKGIIRRISLLLEHRPNYNKYTWKQFKTRWMHWIELQANLYLKSFSVIPKFNYQTNEWPKIILWRRRFPLLIAVPDFFIVIFSNLRFGGYKEGFIAWKVGFLFGVSRLVIDWLVFWGKIRGKIKN